MLINFRNVNFLKDGRKMFFIVQNDLAYLGVTKTANFEVEMNLDGLYLPRRHNYKFCNVLNNLQYTHITQTCIVIKMEL